MTAGSPADAARIANARAHLAAAREPTAVGPGPDAETLRIAYLDLLKLCLCDLTGTSTISVGALEDGTVMSRELRAEARKLRAAGMDWPLQGLTMVGLGRLDDLQACVESVVADGVAGDLIEAGTWRGGAAILMRATLDCLGEERTVWVADSFEGFAPADPPEDGTIDLAAYDFLSAPLDEVRRSFARLGCDRGVEFLPGYFADTLAGLSGRGWAIVRLDADTYEATRHALRCLYPRLAVGGHLVVDDYGSFAGCREAVDEFRREHGIAEPLHHVDSTCVRWRRESDAPIAPVRPPVDRPARPVAGPPRRAGHVPSGRELELGRELDALRARLAAAETELARRRPRARLRRLTRRRPR